MLAFLSEVHPACRCGTGRVGAVSGSRMTDGPAAGCSGAACLDVD